MKNTDVPFGGAAVRVAIIYPDHVLLFDRPWSDLCSDCLSGGDNLLSFGATAP